MSGKKQTQGAGIPLGEAAGSPIQAPHATGGAGTLAVSSPAEPNPASNSTTPKSPKPQAKEQAAAPAPKPAAHQDSISKQGSAAQGATYESTTLAVAAHCPAALKRMDWCVTDFDLRALMYNGNISMVYHAVDKRSGITVALKLYKRHKLSVIERHQVAREIKLHIGLAHDAIIAMYAAWKDRSFVYLALEWAPGGDVYSYLRQSRGRLSEDVAVSLIMEPFLSGLAVIHAQGLIHRDIKPENILLNNSFQIKIADFGLSIDSRNEVANTRLGTIDYLAPEILDCPVKQNPNDNKNNPNIGYTSKVDCWSCGVLAYELLTGQPPFAAPHPQETLRLIRTKEVEYPAYLSREAVDFMRSVLVREPTHRPTIAELLEHPWIRRYCRRSVPQADARFTRRNSVPLSLLSQGITRSTPGHAKDYNPGSPQAVKPPTPGSISPPAPNSHGAQPQPPSSPQPGRTANNPAATNGTQQTVSQAPAGPAPAAAAMLAVKHAPMHTNSGPLPMLGLNMGGAVPHAGAHAGHHGAPAPTHGALLAPSSASGKDEEVDGSAHITDIPLPAGPGAAPDEALRQQLAACKVAGGPVGPPTPSGKPNGQLHNQQPHPGNHNNQQHPYDAATLLGSAPAASRSAKFYSSQPAVAAAHAQAAVAAAAVVSPTGKKAAPTVAYNYGGPGKEGPSSPCCLPPIHDGSRPNSAVGVPSGGGAPPASASHVARKLAFGGPAEKDGAGF